MSAKNAAGATGHATDTGRVAHIVRDIHDDTHGARNAHDARALIITADDFGLHERVNLAVERAHRHGVLNAASLMVGARAARDAVERARRLPTLGVGLHLVLADGAAMLPRAAIPALVDADGRFGQNMVRDGLRFFLLPHVRAQLAREIRAQFDAFAATGLPLDHVNTHKHFHLHPTVLTLILEIGRDYGLRAMRLPGEARAPVWLRPWIARVRARLRRARIAHNDYVIGIAQTGNMDEAALLAALAHLPPGVGEIYCHPAVATLDGRADCAGCANDMNDAERAAANVTNATSDATGTAPDAAGAANATPATPDLAKNAPANADPLTPAMRAYRHADELAALLSPRVAAALDASGAVRGSFATVFAQKALETMRPQSS